MSQEWDNLQAELEKRKAQMPAPGPTFTKVEGFQKERFKSDGTKVGGVEAAVLPKVASGIESAKKSKFGFIVNPAMNVMEHVGEKIITPITQGVSTALLMGDENNVSKTKGLAGLAESYRHARKASKKISMGQALATQIGAVAGDLLPDSITPTFMDENFNVFNGKQRTQAFRDETWGILASGATDLTIAMLGTKGTGSAVKAGAKKLVGSNRIVTGNDMAKFSKTADEAVTWAESGATTPAPSGLATLIDDAVKETNLTRISVNPLVSETSNPYRTATILSRLDNHRDVADYLMAERGDTAAFARFMERRPLDADHLDNYGINTADPITDFSNIGLDALDPKLTARYQSIIDAKTKTDKAFGQALDDFMSKATVGVLESYQPGKFGILENANLMKKKLGMQAKYGDLKLFGKDGGNGWRSEVYQTNTYDRAIRMIAWVGSGRPQGHINISNPRKFEAANDLLSDLNRLQMLSGKDGVKFKRDMVEKYLAAQDDTQRAIALANIETAVMTKLAKHYGVGRTGDIRNAEEAVARIKEWHAGTSERRAALKDYATKHGFIPDEDGNINVSNFFSVSNEAQTLPMLDFRKLEIEVIENTNRLAKGVSPISAGQLAGATISKRAMQVGELFDLANMVFNNLNLLRFAYIPKNSMVDPFARGSMAMESMELVGNALPGIKNTVYNSSLRKQQLSQWIPGTKGAHARRMEQAVIKEIDNIAGDLDPAVMRWEDAQKFVSIAEKRWQEARKVQEKAAANVKSASPANKAYAESAKHEADYALYRAQSDLVDANDVLDREAFTVRNLSTQIEKHRAAIQGSVIKNAELKQRKYLGQESEVIEVNGKKYTIAGLADPNVRGASAYMDEVDSASNFYSASMQSEISRRLKAEGSRFVTIKRSEGKPYWNALAHIANRQVRSELDMPLGMMFKGESDMDVLRWLYKGDAGKEYRRRMSSRAGHELSKDEYMAWISSTGDKLRKMYPSPELRKIIAERPVTVKEVETLLRNKPDLLETIDGPNISLNELNKAERILAKVGVGTDAAWRMLSVSENRLVRNPMFLSYTRDEMRTLINAAQRSGIDPSDAVVNNQIRQVAYRNALSRVEQTLYSSRRLTNGMYAARYAMSFPLAFFNSQTVALRLMAKNPMNAYWYNSISNAFDNFEAYEDKDGNTYKKASDVPPGTAVTVKYPLPLGNKLPGWAKQALAPYMDGRGGGLKWNPKQMEFMVADPSVSWFGTVLISDLVKNGFMEDSPWGIYGEDIAKSLRSTFGDDFYESSILYGGYPTEGGNLISTAFNTVMPSYQTSIWQGIMQKVGIDSKNDRWVDEVFTNYRVMMSEWDRNGRVGNPPTMKTAAKAAGNMSFIRAAVQFFAPIATTFDPVTRSATQYYSQLLEENNGDYDAAQKQMEEDWGLDSLALIGSNNKNIAGLAANYSDIKVIRNNPDLLAKIARYNPKFSGMLSTGYGDLTTEYSTEVAAIYKRLKIPGIETAVTQKKTNEELMIDVNSNLGWAEYRKATEWRDSVMAQYGVGSPSEARYASLGIKQKFEEMVNSTASDFPEWVREFNGERKDFWKQTLPALKAIANDPKWRKHADNVKTISGEKSTKWVEIAQWVEVAEEYDRLSNGYGMGTAAQQQLKSRFNQFHYNFIQTASDEFAAFAARWLESNDALDITLVVG